MPEPTAGRTAVMEPAAGGGGLRPGETEDLLDEEPRRRISPVRVLLAIALLGAAITAGVVGIRNHLATTGVVRSTWFGPYVDVTLTPTYQFQDPADNNARQVVLGFVVADRNQSCTPSWGGRYTEAQASSALELDSRIAQVQNEGAQVIASFGGQKPTDLAVACTSTRALASAYESVISRYHLTTIDLDIEGSELDNYAAIKRAAAAVAMVEADRRAAHAKLDVWLTLPVATNGLQDNALSVVRTMLRSHAVLAGVDVMAMDFGGLAPGTSMSTAAEESLTATHGQLAALFPRYGIDLRSKQIWNRMGVTVMIGQNNRAAERFTVADARRLAGFASKAGLGRTSVWSLNRDSQCGSSFAVTGILSNTCSGVPQSNLGFSKVFAHLDGTATSGVVDGGRVVTPAPDKNPADAPYPQWEANQAYQTGYKVVRQGYIYQSKWYNQGHDPASDVQYQWQTPWLLVGPVVVGDHAPELPTLPEGTYPAWTAATSYQTGDRVLLDGLPYQAKWDSQGVSPAAEAADPSASPWQPLFTIPGEPATS